MTLTTDLWSTELFEIELFLHLPLCKRKLYLYLTELFELKLFDYVVEYTVPLLTTRNTYVYKNIRLYFVFGDDTCVEQKSNRREFTHTKELSGDARASEQLTLAEIRELT